MNKAILDAIENRLTTWLLKRTIPLYSQIPPTASAIPASPELGLRQPLRACFNQRPSPSPGRMRSPIPSPTPLSWYAEIAQSCRYVMG